MLSYRYSWWDGSQALSPLHEEEVMEELSDYLLAQSDLSHALRMMMQRGLRNHPLMGLQDLLQRLRAARQQRLDQYNLNSIMEEIQKRLEQVVETERDGIQHRLEETRERAQRAQQAQSHPEGDLSPEAAQRLLNLMERMVQEKSAFLDQLPKSPAGAIHALSEYEFMDPEAQRQFQELLAMLQQQVSDSLFQDLSQSLSQMSPEQMEQLRRMVQELNEMLQEKMAGGEPDFERFMQQYGHMFGPNPPQSLEELVEQMQRQRTQMQSLLDSLSPQMRQSLRELMNSLTQDMDLQQELGELAALLEYLSPSIQRRHQYPFRGDDPLTLQEAMRVMEELQKLEELERQIKNAQYGDGLDAMDPQQVRELVGEEEASALEKLQNLTKMLEEAGYLRSVDNRLELTPRGMRKIGQKALKDIFDRLKRDRFGRHEVERRGVGVDRSDETKTYEFGDPFLLHLERTVMNAVFREPGQPPLKLQPGDFEVYRTELLTQSSTVLMLDLSWSMARRGSFYAAKKVILALHNLIKTQFPRDNLYVVGFSTYARELKADQLPYITWDQAEPYTNMQQGFMISQKLLARHKAGTKQIIMISDGEPTAHIEGGQVFLGYPPSPRTIQETLREVKRCTQQSIVINTFMLDRSYYLKEFVDQLTRINRGRAFYTSPDKLGQYVLVDYIAGKRRRIA